MSGAEVSTIRNEIAITNLDDIKEIIIQAGGNDVSRGRDLEAIEEDFIEIIRDVKRRSPHTKVFISEVTPRKKGRKNEEKVDVPMEDVNEMIISVCEMNGATLIRSSIAISRVNRRQFHKDDLHINFTGTRDLLYAYEQYVPVLKNGIRYGSCSFCGEKGHNSKKCHHGGEIVCYLCNGSGHKAKMCYYANY